MKKIPLNKELKNGLTIFIFTEGTILKPKSWLSIYNHKYYIPIGRSVEIISKWDEQGANIIYCTSRKKKQADDLSILLKKYGFVGLFCISREEKESYKSIVEALKPDILIEDDCKSIGGSWQMCITKISPDLKQNIKSIVVPEFKGIDNLPMDLHDLSNQK